ncbi:zeta toxin family protein [Microbacterium sp. LRZ72]|uniref:zeta toxin family protein n=1 Tax=Microbacterium sp. LRZ72 TaxID=2942481 RepID=UPI0029B021A6|nr:zeta toxin family protein [Microbacterium sp. LRZ72]MDX2377759.1 zeta toxin family protein [Microbacterium sp. LRZ72]
MSGVDGAAMDAGKVFERSILPMLFPTADPEPSPRLTLIAGGQGSGRVRAIHRALRSAPGAAVVSADDLRGFHPRAAESDARATVAADVAEWLRLAIAHAREHSRSLIIEGEFPRADVVRGVIEQFTEAGFVTDMILVVPRRPETLLAAASAHFRDVHRGIASLGVSAADHDMSWRETRGVIEKLADVGRRASLMMLDGAGNEVGGVSIDPLRATSAFDQAREGSPTGRAAIEWLGELRRLTDFVRILPPRATDLDVLIELHQIALRDVVPSMQLPANSTTGPQLESRLAAESAALRRQRATLPSSEPTAAPTPPSPGLDR